MYMLVLVVDRVRSLLVDPLTGGALELLALDTPDHNLIDITQITPSFAGHRIRGEVVHWEALYPPILRNLKGAVAGWTFSFSHTF